MPHWRCQDCPALFGAWLSRCPRCGSSKGLEMALNECANCTTAFAVGLKRCPHCASTDFTEQGQDMPKITVHGGASDASVAPEQPAAEPEPEGGEESSLGTSSSTSAETPQQKSEPSSKPPRSPARTTASRSKKGQTESSSAPSTDGGQETGTSAADDK